MTASNRRSAFRRLAAGAAAAPLAVLLTAAGASAAPEVDPVPVDVYSKGAQITLDITGEQVVYETGRLKGDLNLIPPTNMSNSIADSVFLHRMKGGGGDFGHVDVLIGPGAPIEGDHGRAPQIEFPQGIDLQVRKFPGGLDIESGGDPISLVTDPILLEPIPYPEEFPPTHQQYALEDSASIYYLDASDGSLEKIGTLEAFDSKVNW
jgi:hypothetical protein